MSIAGVVGRGLAAGAPGTVALTLAEKAEIALTGREPSTVDAAGIRPKPATLAFFPIVWAGDAALYFALGVAPPPWQWSRQELMTDWFGKGVLAFAPSGAFIALERAR